MSLWRWERFITSLRSTLSVSARATLTLCNKNLSSSETKCKFNNTVLYFSVTVQVSTVSKNVSSFSFWGTGKDILPPSFCLLFWSPMELPFYWQIMKPNLPVLLPGPLPESSNIHFHPATDDVFHISPTSGVLAPCQDQEYLLTFSPKEVMETKLHRAWLKLITQSLN